MMDITSCKSPDSTIYCCFSPHALLHSFLLIIYMSKDFSSFTNVSVSHNLLISFSEFLVMKDYLMCPWCLALSLLHRLYTIMHSVGSSWVHAVSEVCAELKFSSLNWLSLEPFSVPGHQSLKSVLNTLV